MIKVIAAIDNSAAARPVVAAAEAVAAVLGAEVEAVHVATDGDTTARGVARAAGVGFRVVTDVDDPVTALLEIATEPEVAGMVIGARGTPGGARPAGHVTLGVIERVTKPAVVVPPEAPVADKLHCVVVPMMGDPKKAASVWNTIELVNAAHIEVVVVHVSDEASIPAFSDQPQYESDAWAQEFLARYLPISPEAVRLELRVGIPLEQVLQVSSEVGADMIALGWMQRMSEERGRLVRGVLERSTIPVILLPVFLESGGSTL